MIVVAVWLELPAQQMNGRPVEVIAVSIDSECNLNEIERESEHGQGDHSLFLEHTRPRVKGVVLPKYAVTLCVKHNGEIVQNDNEHEQRDVPRVHRIADTRMGDVAAVDAETVPAVPSPKRCAQVPAEMDAQCLLFNVPRHHGTR